MPGVRTGRDLAITIDTRNDLLFTMSDNTYLSPAPREAPRVHHAMKHELFSTDEPDPDWWSQTGSNRRPPACKAGALPAELWPQKSVSLPAFNLPPAAYRGAAKVGGPGKI